MFRSIFYQRIVHSRSQWNMQTAPVREIPKFLRHTEYRLVGYVCAIQRLSTADGTNEPFPIDTETLKDAVRGGASVSRGETRGGIVSGSEQATILGIYIGVYTGRSIYSFNIWSISLLSHELSRICSSRMIKKNNKFLFIFETFEFYSFLFFVD